ncbi:MAG: B12-binding domain-containing radical SAM protein [Desulfatibacillaceae bacterium]
MEQSITENKSKQGFKILFLFPNIHILTPKIFPMECGLLSTIAKQHGHETRIFVADSLPRLKKVPRVLREFQPDVVGVTAIGSQAQYALEMAKMAKQWRDVPVIMGGKHASLAPEDLVHRPELDAVVVGEGEHALVEYLEALRSGSGLAGIRNLWYRDGGEVRKNPPRPFIDLDTLPLPDYEALDYQAILNRNYKTVVGMVTRGCPAKCTFCGVPWLARTGTGQFCRVRSIPHIVDEFRYLDENYDFNYVYFRDDTFTMDRDWTLEFCEAWPKHFSQGFEILTRADTLDEELLDALKNAGCQCIWIGADSGNDTIREKILHKNVSNRQLVEVCDYMQKIGIRPCLTNMIGLPYETPERFEDTIELNRRVYGKKDLNISAGNGPLPKLFTFSPFPGTPLWSLCEKEGWLNHIPRGFKTYEESYIDMPQFPKKEVYRAKRRFRYLVYKDSHPWYARFLWLVDSPFGRFLAEKVNVAHYPFNWLMKSLSRVTDRERGKSADIPPEKTKAAA